MINSKFGKVGSKTEKLFDLIALGLKVPKFKTINSREISDNFRDFNSIATEIHSELKCQKYAVRSSALIEDSEKKSFAGQFKTKIDVSPEKLVEAIKEIAEPENFSIIIQEYIEPDIAGVTFTRNPLGGREIIIEFHRGRGEELVGGKIKPLKLELYWSQKIMPEVLPNFSEAIKNFKKIEEFFAAPQDIEWCIKNGKWYYLQTRPITNLSKNDYQKYIFLDRNLPHENFFYFAKTEISEIAARPTEITKSLLEKIYANNGPVQKVYQKYQIKYVPQDILKIIGNELMIDREAELKSLLPSFSYQKSSNLNAKLNSFHGFWQTIKNIFYLQKINPKNWQEIFQKIKKILENDQEIRKIDEFIKIFLLDYETVFEINLLATVANKKMSSLLPKNIPPSLILSAGWPLIDQQYFDLNFSDAGNLSGNTLEISDESKFMMNKVIHNSFDKNLVDCWDNLSGIKKNILLPKIESALIFNRLREISRWLVVKRVNQLRHILKKKNQKNIFFFTLDEILQNNLSLPLGGKRAAKYYDYNKFLFPNILCSKIILPKNKNLGISIGTANGILIPVEEIHNPEYKNLPKILHAKILSPNLVKYFTEIKGIISQEGGLLSHLAIIAREKKLPVVISNENLKTGQKIKINGETGEISRI